MSNYDDLFNEAPEKQPKQEAKEFVPFDREAWAAQKQQDRANAYALIDSTVSRMANNPELFKNYLDVQARFDRYSVGNAILIAAQRPDMTEPAEASAWKEQGVYIKKGEAGVVILEPGEEYTREDGSVGVSFNAKRVFDVSQTNANTKPTPVVNLDTRLLVKALIHNAPCGFKISDELPENQLAIYDPKNKIILVRQGLEAPDIFRSISAELAHAHMDKNGEYERRDNVFTAYCASYVICQRNHMPTHWLNLEKMPAEMSGLDAQQIRSKLAKIRDVSNEISADMRQVLEKAQTPKSRDDSAR